MLVAGATTSNAHDDESSIDYESETMSEDEDVEDGEQCVHAHEKGQREILDDAMCYSDREDQEGGYGNKGDEGDEGDHEDWVVV